MFSKNFRKYKCGIGKGADSEVSNRISDRKNEQVTVNQEKSGPNKQWGLVRPKV